MCQAPNFYLLVAPTTPAQWNECNSFLDCKGGAEIYPVSGYWRLSNETNYVYVWFIDKAWR